MATCTPQTAVSKSSNQSTLFSFMKKKNPSDEADPKANLNFVTPASKDISPVANKHDDGVKLEESNDDEQDSDIERLVSHSSVAGTPAPIQSSDSVVDLTTDNMAETSIKITNVVSAVKKRKPATKKKSSVVAINSVLAAITPVAKQTIVDTCVDDDDLEKWADEVAEVAVVKEATTAMEVVDQVEATPVEVTRVEEAPVVEEPAPKTPAATKKRTRKASVKKVEAVESAALDPEAAEGVEKAEESAQDADGEASPVVDASSSETKSAPKRTKKPAVKPTVVEIVYPPHVLVKQQTQRDRLSGLVAELLHLESCADSCDQQLDVEAAVDDLIAAATQPWATEDSPAATESTEIVVDSPVEASEPVVVEETDASDLPASEVNEVAAVAEEIQAQEGDTLSGTAIPIATASVLAQSAEEKAQTRAAHLVRTLIVRTIQGSSKTLREVTALALSALKTVTQRLEDLPDDEDLSESAVAAIKVVNDAVQKMSDPIVLAEEVKIIAPRTSFGNRPAKATMFDCTDQQAVWRCDCTGTLYFTKSASAIVLAARALRNRYGRALKAVAAVLAVLSKQPLSDSRLAEVEETAVKRLSEVEKAKERRKETEAKRAAEAEDKRRKEEAKEQKRIEKEESDRARKAALDATKAEKAEKAVVEKEPKKPSAHSEKVQKKAAELEKSKNMFMNFLKKAAPVAVATTPAAVASSSSPQRSGASSSSTAEVLDLTSLEDEKLARFEAAMASELAMSEIMKYQRERYSTRMPCCKSTRPRKIDLHVTVIVPDPVNRGAFGGNDNTYSEIQERSFSNKIRTLSFHEDHRPAYVGTVSRTSRVISGRRPLARDTELLNYEYDSEEDWEEEVEGEDLNDTDEEEEDGGKDELEYDDFFRRDDDYGSDAEGDNLDGAVKVCSRNVVELYGPRFISPTACSALVVDAREENVDKNSLLKARRFESAVSTFSIFDLSTGEMVHRAVKSDAASTNLSSYAAVSFATHPAPTLGQFETASAVVKEKKISEKKEKSAPSTDKKVATVATSSAAPSIVASTSAVVGESDTPVGTEVKSGALRGFDESKMPHLARFVHGKKEGVDKIVAAFHEMYPACTKMQIQKRLKDMTDKVKHSEGYGSQRWIVKSEVLQKYSIESAELEEVIFTPLKKKKRTPTTLIASSIEELQALAQQSTGVSVALFPQSAEKPKAPVSPQVSAIPVVDVTSAFNVAPAVSAFSPAASSSAGAIINILVPKSKPKTATSASTAVTPSSGTKRKSDTPAAPRSAKKPSSVTAAVTPSAEPVESVQETKAESVTPTPISDAPVSAAKAVVAKVAPSTGTKKITSFLFGAAAAPAACASPDTTSASSEAREVILVEIE